MRAGASSREYYWTGRFLDKTQGRPRAPSPRETERKDDLFDSEKIRAVEAGAVARIHQQSTTEQDLGPVPSSGRPEVIDSKKGVTRGSGIRRGGVKSKDPSKTNEGESTDQGHTRRSRTIVGGSKVRRARRGQAVAEDPPF